MSYISLGVFSGILIVSMFLFGFRFLLIKVEFFRDNYF